MPTRSDSSVTRLRLTVLMVTVTCLFAALLARLWFLQVSNATNAVALTNGTDVVTVYLPAPRGEILDRNGTVIVGNRLSQVVQVSQHETTQYPDVLQRLAIVLGLPLSALRTEMASKVTGPYQPVTVSSDVPENEILYLREHQSQFPGVTTGYQWVRTYPYGQLAANIVGYIGQITASEYHSLKHHGYLPNDQIGQAGVEASFEQVLRGVPGREELEVTASGQVLRVVHVTPPIPGHNVALSISLPLQNRAQMALEEAFLAARRQAPYAGKLGPEPYNAHSGAVVVEDPQNGQILALATEPTYDPSVWVGGISEANYQHLTSPASANPLLDRAIQGAYPPGSTFKLVTATAGLRYGVITPSYVYNDTGSLTIGGQVFHDNAGVGAGQVDLSQAITVSSDNYFNRIGALLWQGNYPTDALQSVAAQYGFNTPTGVGLPGESGGQILSPALVKELHARYPKAYPYDQWYTGNNVQEAIGQDGILVTPVQLANAYSAFANGGHLLVPQIALHAETVTGRITTTYHSHTVRTITLPAGQRAAILSGFEGVIDQPSGTAYSDFAGTPLMADHLAGKTGTAQVTGQAPTSVFVGFGPTSNPQYVVDAMIPRAGYGASIAAPVVRQIFEQIYHDPITPI